MMRFSAPFAFSAALLAGASALSAPAAGPARAQEARREFTVVARSFEFAPARLEVRHNDLVKIVLRAEDIPHSFTIDDYRIAKRAAVGQSVTFEFRADRPGSFRFYCNLSIDDGCREMHGELVVRD